MRLASLERLGRRLNCLCQACTSFFRSDRRVILLGMVPSYSVDRIDGSSISPARRAFQSVIPERISCFYYFQLEFFDERTHTVHTYQRAFVTGEHRAEHLRLAPPTS